MMHKQAQQNVKDKQAKTKQYVDTKRQARVANIKVGMKYW